MGPTHNDRGKGSAPPTAWFRTSTSMPNGANSLANLLPNTAGQAVCPKPSWPAVTDEPNAATTNLPPPEVASLASFALESRCQTRRGED